MSAALTLCKKVSGITVSEKFQINSYLSDTGGSNIDSPNSASPEEKKRDAEESLSIARALTARSSGDLKVTVPSTEDYAKTSNFTVKKSANGDLMSTAPEAVLTFLSVLTEVAVKKAKRNGLVYLQEEMKTAVCGLTTETATETATRVLPDTCRLLGGVSLERIASEPEVLAAAITRDLMTITAREMLKRAHLAETEAGRALASLIDLAIGVGAHTFETKNYRLSTADVNLLINTILAGHVNSTVNWDNKVIAVAIGGLGLAIHRAHGEAAIIANTDIPRLLGELCPDGGTSLLTCSAQERAKAAQLTALAVKALTASSDAGDADTHARAVASIQLLFAIAEELPLAAETKVYIEDLRSVLLAAMDRDIARALVSAGHFLTLVIQEGCKEECKTCEEKCGEHTRAIEKATILLAAMTSYASTYVTTKDGELSTEELRGRRTAALEAAIDAFTSRKGASSRWIASLGLPVGFSGGGQSLRAIDPSSGEYGFLRPEVMLPQLSLPLGFAVQRVPGPKHIGLHLMATALDLAQFVAYDANAELSKVTWNSFMSPGMQLGVLVGSPTNSFVIAGEVRYAPSLFKVGDGSMPGDQPGGALRFGLFLAYYVPLFDVPFRSRSRNLD